MQRKRFILTVVLPIALSIVIGACIVVFSNNFIIPSKARALVTGEKNELTATISDLEDQVKTVNSEIENYDSILEENQGLLTEIETLKTELEHYTSDVTDTQAKVDELDDQIAEKRAYLESLSSISEETEDASKKLSEGEYKCPGDIPAGRYSIEGSAKIYLYSISNSLTLKEDLSTLDTRSYRLEIASGETLKIEGGTVTLTSLVTNAE